MTGRIGEAPEWIGATSKKPAAAEAGRAKLTGRCYLLGIRYVLSPFSGLKDSTV